MSVVDAEEEYVCSMIPSPALITADVEAAAAAAVVHCKDTKIKSSPLSLFLLWLQGLLLSLEE